MLKQEFCIAGVWEGWFGGSGYGLIPFGFISGVEKERFAPNFVLPLVRAIGRVLVQPYSSNKASRFISSHDQKAVCRGLLIRRLGID